MSYLLVRSDAGRIPLGDGTVHCVVTSPPYWNLRDYQIAGQLGLERTPEAFVASLVEVFREVRRVLRDDGTCWLNMGDTYNAYNAYNGGAGPGSKLSKTQTEQRPKLASGFGLQCKTLKPKDLIGIPWMLAFALRADGWYLRSDIVWSKPNPMRESVRDRPTKSHEYLFLLTKRERYFCDMEAIKTASAPASRSRLAQDVAEQRGSHRANGGAKTNGTMKAVGDPGSANKLSVWTVPTKPLKIAHFATFPPKLIIPCIKAGTSEKGCCLNCGAPWRRVVKRKRVTSRPGTDTKIVQAYGNRSDIDPAINWRNSTLNYKSSIEVGNRDPQRHVTSTVTVGWESSCGCLEARHPVPAIVFDPFGGAGTTPMVAMHLGRHGIASDLNPDYLDLAARRIVRSMRPVSRLDPAPARAPLPGQLPLF